MRWIDAAAILLGASTAIAACGDLFHTTDWQSFCDSQPDDPTCSSHAGGASSSHAVSHVATGSGGASSSSSSSGAVGSGGSGGGVDCSAIPGALAYGGHCYVELQGSQSWDAARPACAAVGKAFNLTSHLMLIDDASEEAFIEAKFLDATKDTQDGWMGYWCSDLIHPLVAECSCPGGCADQATQDAKRASWGPIDNLTGSFADWAPMNPNGDGRCAALSFQLNAYGYVDRDCTMDNAPEFGGVRTYRVICEIEGP